MIIPCQSGMCDRRVHHLVFMKLCPACQNMAIGGLVIGFLVGAGFVSLVVLFT